MKRGFALLTILWLIVALAGLVTLGARGFALGRPQAENRMAATRARWAARACGELFRGRFAQDTMTFLVDSTSLGSNAWCTATRDLRNAKLDVNRVSASQLSLIIPDQALVAAILDWRDGDDQRRPNGAEREDYGLSGLPANAPFTRLEELAQVRGMTPSVFAQARDFLDIGGDGRINPNLAPVLVLGAIEVMPPGGAEALGLARRQTVFRTASDVADALKGAGISVTIGTLRELSQRMSFLPQPEALIVSGHVMTARGLASERFGLGLVREGRRLFVIREQPR